jgi:UDP-MurNAc hydroxylase
MKINLVSHASVVLDSNESVIWTDPWLSGKAFNNSWALLPEASFDSSLLDKINYVWISHEHPDHFHIPTLRSLPASFKERVTVLYQKLNSEKMLAAFKQLGFKNVSLLPHREPLPLSDHTTIYSYYVGVMDSCLAVKNTDATVLNANDAQIGSPDCELILKDIGKVDTLLTQFSIAFYSGLRDYDERLRRMAQGILQRISANHRDLGVARTIPFASFIYYCSEENRFINQYHNTPRAVYEYFKARGQAMAVLYPGDLFDSSKGHDSSAALERYDQLHAGSERLVYDPPVRVEFSEVSRAFTNLCNGLHERYPSSMLKMLRTLTVRIPDLGKTVLLSVGRRSLIETDDSAVADLTVGSQALHFAFANPFGFQTLGISGRLVLNADSINWRMHHLLFVLNNAEISLRPKYFFTRKTLGFLRERSSGGMNLLSYVGSRMRRLSPLESSELKQTAGGLLSPDILIKPKKETQPQL